MWGECRLEVHDNIGTITESSMGGQWSLVACCFAVSLGPLWTTWGVQSTAAGSNPGRGTCRNEGESEEGGYVRVSVRVRVRRGDM